MKKLFYVRHGKTVGNLEGNYIGRTESDLIAEGIEGAHRAARQIIESGEKIDAIYCASLSRQQDTARIIAEDIGFPTDQIRINDLLLERAGGDYEGKPQRDFFAATEEEQVAAGAEPFRDLADRTVAMVKLTKENHPDETVLFVGSAAVGEMMRAMIKYQDHTRMFDDGPIPNTELIRFI